MVGDDAEAAGYALVPDTGEGGEVRFGAREINRTRDYIAILKAAILNPWPVNKGGTGASTSPQARTNLGISSGTGDAADDVGGAVDGNIYFKIVG